MGVGSKGGEWDGLGPSLPARLPACLPARLGHSGCLDSHLFPPHRPHPPTPKQHKADPAVQHALQVRQAWSLGNYHRLGRLSRAVPHLGRYIIEHFVGQARIRALQAIVKAYEAHTPSHTSGR